MVDVHNNYAYKLTCYFWLIIKNFINDFGKIEIDFVWVNNWSNNIYALSLDSP